MYGARSEYSNGRSEKNRMLECGMHGILILFAMLLSPFASSKLLPSQRSAIVQFIQSVLTKVIFFLHYHLE